MTQISVVFNGQDVILNGVRAYAVYRAGSLWFFGRAGTRETYEARALEAGLLLHSHAAVSEGLVQAPGVTLMEWGPFTLAPGTYAEDGTEITAPIIDPRFHFNIYLGPSVVARGTWKYWVAEWMLNGVVAPSNNMEAAKEFDGIELIDPVTVQNWANRLAL